MYQSIFHMGWTGGTGRVNTSQPTKEKHFKSRQTPKEFLNIEFLWFWYITPPLLLPWKRWEKGVPLYWYGTYFFLGSGKDLGRQFFYYYYFVPRVPYTVLGFFTLFTIFGRMPGFEPELLRPQAGVQPTTVHTSLKLEFRVGLKLILNIVWLRLRFSLSLKLSFMLTLRIEIEV